MKTYTYICIEDSIIGLRKDKIYSIRKTDDPKIIELTGHLFLNGEFDRVANMRINPDEIKNNLKLIS